MGKPALWIVGEPHVATPVIQQVARVGRGVGQCQVAECQVLKMVAVEQDSCGSPEEWGTMMKRRSFINRRKKVNEALDQEDL